jgi:hypothetical protein
MKFRRSDILGLVAVMAGLLSAACSSDAPEASALPDDEGEGAYMTLRISASGMGRSNPTGGEEGDGRVPGIRNENTISNLVLFFYDGQKGLDSDALTTFKYVRYFDDTEMVLKADGYVEYLFRLDTYVPAAGDRVAVVANMGPSVTRIKTLGALRQEIVGHAWREAGSLADYNMFAMSSAFADDGAVDVENYSGTKESPFRAWISVERVAARIDLRFDRSQISVFGENRELVYNAGATARVHLTHAAVVNAMQSGTWMMKHVTESADAPGCFATLKICGNEDVDGAGMPTNYVVEPSTTLKNDATDATQIESWYGDTRAEYMRRNYAAVFASGRGNLSPLLSDGRLAVDDRTDGFDMSMTLAYVNENTQPKEMHDSRFMTGLLFKAVYEPNDVYADDEASVKADYNRGETFWRYSPTRWEMDEETCLYFSNEVAAEAYRRSHPEDMGQVEEFPAGECYYNLWLRHARVEGAGAQDTPMGYGIVRNNIYRVGVSFTGPGRPNADVSEPENIESRIFVRKWNFRLHPTIIM